MYRFFAENAASFYRALALRAGLARKLALSIKEEEPFDSTAEGTCIS